VSYLTARFVNHEEILRAKNEAEQLRAQRDSIEGVVAERDSVQATLQVERENLQRQVDTLRVRVATMEEKRAAAQLEVRFLNNAADVENKLRQTFPEVDATMKIAERTDEETGLAIEYLMVPLWFGETFVIDHQNAESFRNQRDTLLVMDSLHVQIVALQDSVFSLEQLNRMAYQDGYNDALGRYEDLSGKYIDLLEKPPQVTLGLPKWGWMAGSAVVGLAVGVLIK
jgi:chromosome segregation ATPase